MSGKQNVPDAEMAISSSNQQDTKTAGKKETTGSEGSKAISKLKDPNQAHETLEIAKNVP